jgi:hypothetical protein
MQIGEGRQILAEIVHRGKVICDSTALPTEGILRAFTGRKSPPRGLRQCDYDGNGQNVYFNSSGTYSAGLVPLEIVRRTFGG